MTVAVEEEREWTQRMERLERKSRWQLALTVVVALLCAMVLVWQFLPLDSLIEARGFILRDSQLRTWGELRLRDDGNPVLRLNHRNGQSAAVLTVRDNGTVALRLYDTVAQQRAEVRLDEQGVPTFTLTGANGKSRVLIAAEEAGDAGEQRIVLRDRFGRAVWSAPSADRETP